MMAATYDGGCHCGRIRFRVQGPLDEISDCNCSMCAKKGILHWIVAPERFELLSGAEDIATYTFNTGVARHTFCRHCGIHPFYTPRSDPDKVDVNARCLDDVDLSKVRVRTFDGRNWERAKADRDGR
jgi:hypothetical protein